MEQEVQQETSKAKAPTVMAVVKQILEDEKPGSLAQVGDTIYKDTQTEQGFVDCTADIERKAHFLLTRCAKRSGAMTALASFISVPQATSYKCTPYSYWRELDPSEHDEGSRLINNHWEPITMTPTAVVFSDGVLELKDHKFKTWEELGYRVFGPRIMLKFSDVKAAKPTAKFNEFISTLETVMPDKEARVYFQKAMSRVIQPHVNIKRAIFIQGPSGSRKTTVATAILCAPAGVGGISIEAVDALAEDKHASANLIGKFANLSDDPEGKSSKWVSWFKRYTGSSMMRGETKYVQSKNYATTAKLVICCNRLPQMGDSSDAVWARLCVFNFQRDGELQKMFETDTSENHKLHTEYWSDHDTRCAIVSWLLRGLELVQEEGMVAPKSVKEWNKAAAGDADPVRCMLEDTYELGGEDDFVPTQDIRAMLDQIGKMPSDTTIKGYVKTLFGLEPSRGSVKSDNGLKEQLRGYKGLKRK